MIEPSIGRSFDFGRVFFPGDEKNPAPDEIRFQPLNNHVGNVCELVKCWDVKELPDGESSRERVLDASEIHDMGKPVKFNLIGSVKQGSFQKYIYSFRGHRFLANSDNSWVQKLARGHHDFSAREICKDTYKLRQDSAYGSVLDKQPLAYAQELYVLEMCDQIEAELACRVMDNEKQAESRTFMDFTIQRDDLSIYSIDPWPFKKTLSNIQLSFEYWELLLNATQQAKLNKHVSKHELEKLGGTLDTLVKEWWKNSELTEQDAKSIKITLKPASYISTEDSQGISEQTATDFYGAIANYEPNPMQSEMFDLLYDLDDRKHPAVVLKGPTGAGKTEAVVFPALASRCRLFLPLPARSLLEDQKVRIEEYIKKFSTYCPKQEFSLVVDTGAQMKRYIYQNGEEVKDSTLNPRRHLYKGDIILTTIDKMLYRFFGYGDKQKSFTFPLRLNRRRSLICFDEAHSYDEISFTNFHSLVNALYEAGQSLVVMTATLPQQYQEYFDDFELVDYIDDEEKVRALDEFQRKTLDRPYLDRRAFTWHQDIGRDSEHPEAFQTSVANLALEKFVEGTETRLILVVQRVSDAVEIYKRLREQLQTEGEQKVLYLYHGRIADDVRPKLYQAINEKDTAEEPYLLVTTSAIEVGCDLNAEILITELCPPESLIQRVGRCNRRGNIKSAQVAVVGNSIPDFANTLDEAGMKTYKNTLHEMSGREFATHEISSCINPTQHVDDYRVVEVFSMLYDYIYNADLTCLPAHERGLVPTRSWIPSVELRIVFSDEDYHSISVPVDRLVSGETYAHTCLFERTYDQEKTQWNTSPVRTWGDIYTKQLIVEINNGLDDLVFDDSTRYDYHEDLGMVSLPKIFTAWKQGAQIKLKYDYESDGKKHTVVYSYIDALK
ncbi:MAG: CRISPR-associated helicase Cas3' [Cyanobacteria bacterium J06621_3]